MQRNIKNAKEKISLHVQSYLYASFIGWKFYELLIYPWIAARMSQHETIIFGDNGNEEGADAWSHPKSWLQEKNERSNERMLSPFFSSYGITHSYTHSLSPPTAVGRLFLSRRSLSTEQAGVEKEDVQTMQRKLRRGVDVAESRRMFVLGMGKEGWKTGGADLQTVLRRG